MLIASPLSSEQFPVHVLMSSFCGALQLGPIQEMQLPGYGWRQRLKLQETAAQELQSKCQAQEETSQARQEGKLERLRAVDSKRAKWEARKVRLVAQLQAAEGRVGLPSFLNTQGAPSESTAEVPTPR